MEAVRPSELKLTAILKGGLHVKHTTSCPGTLPDRSLLASLLLAAACFPAAMLAQDGYSATATVVYVAANGSNDLLSTSGSPGGWTTSTPVTGQQSPVAPSMTRFGQYFVVAYVANNGSDDLLVTFSEDSVNWTKSARVT